MTTAPIPSVTAFFQLTATGGSYFTLDDPIKGKLDNVTYLLAGAVASDITSYVRGIVINRGRQFHLDTVTAGHATLEVFNQTRSFDPDYTPGPFYGNLLPGRRVTIAAGGVTIFDGNIDEWDFTYNISGESIVQFEVSDALGALGAKEFDAWTATAGQLPGARITDVLNRTEVAFPVGPRNLDTGTSTLQGDLVASNSNVLNYLQLVAQSDLGVVFASKGNILTFYGRDHSFTGVGAPVFSVTSAGIPYSVVARARGTEQLKNRVGVGAAGGVDQSAADATSQSTYGIRSMSLTGLLLDSDAQASTLAARLLAQYKDPVARISAITVLLHGLAPADQATVLALDLNSVIWLIYTPNGVGTPISKYCLIEGISHTLGPMFHSVTLTLSNLADGLVGTALILDSATAGLLNTNVLAF